MSVMLQHLIMFYKYGGKQLYYFNTFDGQGEINLDGDLMDKNEEVPYGQYGSPIDDDDECDSCTL